ncbi:ninjurin-2-like isoform X1 [Belonocnema kinseyi]|uniref:ninjurin-2-like isoform X1 n=1 Tax=Belonocnema kinseyi TaxID=2817044 RepID=UPI00143E0691|nr:ninjurin-2-like isoform X1 [Belonocnema kinseyi]
MKRDTCYHGNLRGHKHNNLYASMIFFSRIVSFNRRDIRVRCSEFCTSSSGEATASMISEYIATKLSSLKKMSVGVLGSVLGRNGLMANAANVVIGEPPKMWDVNRYATKKTIAQGMLDIALLTTNASQLKFILQIGVEHDYYTLMLTLIGISIGLQLVQGIICVLLGSNFDINNEHHQGKANLWNDVCMSMMVVTVAVNVILSSFELRDSNYVQYRSMKPSISDEGNA